MTHRRRLRHRAIATAGVGTVTLAVALLALAPVSALATFPGHDGVLAWSYSVNFNEGPTPGWNALVTLAGTGGARHQLRYCRGQCPQWSDLAYAPGGGRLAFAVNGDVVVARADGTHSRTLGPGFDPSFTAAGSRLLYVRRDAGKEQIVSSRLDGRDRTVLYSDRRLADPKMSPNGRQIVFGQRSTIWTMNADGSAPTPIISNGKAPDWSPSGSELAYVGVKSGRLYTTSPSGAQRRELPADGLCYPQACGGGSQFVAFSPNGRTLAFDNVDASGDPTLYTMPAMGGPARQIASIFTDDAGGTTLGLSWQPTP